MSPNMVCTPPSVQVSSEDSALAMDDLNQSDRITSSIQPLALAPELLVPLQHLPAAISDRVHLEDFEVLEWGQRLNGSVRDTTTGTEQFEHESTTFPPAQRNAIPIVSSLKSPAMNKWRAAACLIAYFTQGFNDSAVGALLPYIEQRYRVSYAVVSLLFIARALGFLTAGPLTHNSNNRFGRSKTLSACAASNVVAFSLIVPQPPYPVVVLAFYLSGFNFATINALDNVFVVNLQGGTVLLGFMQGFYGVGGIVAPFVATLMVSHGVRWSYFYSILLVLSAANAIAFFFSFRGYETEPTTITHERSTESHEENSVPRPHGAKKGILKSALTNKTTLLGGLLVAAYQGAEVSISGWVVSFLITYRNGDPARVGYVTSGFWGGITLGRFLLVAPAHKIGDGISLIILTLATVGFQVMVWLMPDVVGNAVAVAVIGLLQGPIFPCAAGTLARLLPNWLQVTGLGLITGMGSIGGALGPFFTGLLAQRLGTIVFNPVCITLYAVMLASWLSLPRKPKRPD